MSFLKKVRNFFVDIIILFMPNEMLKEDCIMDSITPEENEEGDFKKEVEKDNIEVEDSIFAKRTIISKLYSLEQDICLFESDFPEKFKDFMEKINCLREEYNSNLRKSNKKLTFEIDPDFNNSLIAKVNRLERDIKMFIEKEVKFNIISKQLQRLIVKVNILYNVSIFNNSQDEKKKVISQLEHALESEKRIVQSFKDCAYILNDKSLKERIINLISYVDYQIFKASLRNSLKSPSEILEQLAVKSQFDKFDYIGVFGDFAKDEISDLGELLPEISDSSCYRSLKKPINTLLENLAYCENMEEKLLDVGFWKYFFETEATLIEMLIASGVERKKTKVKILNKMNISINESEVLVPPRTNACLALTKMFNTTSEKRILIMLKILRNISDEVTYKEIYFLMVLFGVIDYLINEPNSLICYLQKYVEKYPYNEEAIYNKKKDVINSPNKNYVMVFNITDYEREIIKALDELNIDYVITNGNVFINSFYFKELKNVEASLQLNTNNI